MDTRQRRSQAQVLRPKGAADRITVGRADPPPGLAWCVDYLWSVRWDTPMPHVQNVIPRPVVHLAAEACEGEPRLLVHGPSTELFEQKLEGSGRTVAAAFRPGGFHPFLRGAVRDLIDRVVPAEDVLGVDDRSIARRLLDPTLTVEVAGTELAAWLLRMEPAIDPLVDQIAALVEGVEADRSIVRAHQLAEAAGVSNRTLQRWFREYIGVSPKAVVRRHRLLDVAAEANAGGQVDWAALAHELGYTDQSHLIHHFRAVVGKSPASYSEQRDVS